MNTKDIRNLIKAGSDLNVQDKNGMTPLMIAIDQQDLDLVRELLRLGVNVDIVDRYGQTALMLGAGRNLLAAVKLLIEKKANAKLVSRSGLTALGFARENGQKECAEFLRKLGAP